MRRIALAVLLNRPNSVLSPHFGKAKWIMIRDEDGQVSFEQNTALNGRAVVELMVKQGCTDAVFSHIGPGAFAHLEKAGIQGWLGPADMPVQELLEALGRGELEKARPSEEEHPSEPHRVDKGQNDPSHRPEGRCSCSSSH
jgi:predicted Fe-Mo cluster-binding NifX family protein